MLQHKLVPEHQLLSEEEAERVLNTLRISREQLPKIRRSDPVVQVMEKLYGPIEEGRIIKVIRISETAGISEAFRLIVER